MALCGKVVVPSGHGAQLEATSLRVDLEAFELSTTSVSLSVLGSGYRCSVTIPSCMMLHLFHQDGPTLSALSLSRSPLSLKQMMLGILSEQLKVTELETELERGPLL